MKRIAFLVVVAVLAAGCVQHVTMPQLVRSYTMDWPDAVGPDGKALASWGTILVANEPYLQDLCGSRARPADQPGPGGPPVSQMGCVRIWHGDRAEIVVPETNEQTALAHHLERLKGRWCYDGQGNPVQCRR